MLIFFSSEPYRSPTHAGGLFAINRKYFLELGAYDEGLLIWGGENFELSFKIWQCGGSIEWVPCSRVGHVYRSFMPYTFGKLADHKRGALITINYRRVIETWFDDQYKEYFYTRDPMAKFVDMGDIRGQLELKDRLNCKSFEWYMENVAYDVFEKFPKLPPNLHWGDIQSVANDECLDMLGQHPPSTIELRRCDGYGSSQLMKLNSAGQLSHGERCIDGDAQGIKLVVCQLGTVNGPWRYNEKTLTLNHDVQKKCMAVHPSTKKLSLMPCDVKSVYQQWNFKEITPKWV